MWTLGTLDRRTPGAGILGPLNVPAYVAWLAAASSVLLPADELTLTHRALGFVALAAFLLALGARAVLEERSASDAALGGTVVVQALLAPVSLWMLDDHLQAILLVLVAAQLAALRRRRPAIAVLVLANSALFVWLARSQPSARA